MKQTTKKANDVKGSNVVASELKTVANNLPKVNCPDATTTKGKISAKFNIVDETAQQIEAETINKNRLFTEVSDYFCPVKFDSSNLETSLQPLVDSGILSNDAKDAAITKAKNNFLKLHEAEINAAQRLSFAEVVAKLQANNELYKKVLTACKVSELNESNYIDANGVKIYRANQCKDNEGNDRYSDAILTKKVNGVTFKQPLFVETREITTNNIILAIRYFSTFQDANKRLFNQISDYRRILQNVFEAAKKAKDNGFSIEQINGEIAKVFSN